VQPRRPNRDPDFLAALPKILPLCQQAFEVHGEDVSWLNFRWLLRPGKGGATENWYRVANGEMNWLRSKRGPKTRLDQVNDAIAQALAG
jgi:hypothetical protein